MKVRLKGVRSYRIGEEFFEADKVYEVDAELGEKLISSGFFELVEVEDELYKNRGSKERRDKRARNQ